MILDTMINSRLVKDWISAIEILYNQENLSSNDSRVLCREIRSSRNEMSMQKDGVAEKGMVHEEE